MMIEEIAAALNLRASRYGRGRVYSGFCPACGYNKPTFSLEEKDGKPLFYCHSCKDSPAIMAELKRCGLWRQKSEKTHFSDYPRLNLLKPLKTASSLATVVSKVSLKSTKDSLGYLEAQCEASSQAAGTLAAVYLASRKLTRAESPDLRYLPSRKHKESGLYFPVMFCMVRNVAGEITGGHYTFLRPDGSGKAPVEPQKRALGKIQGSSIHLAEAGPILAISEGIETGLAFMQETGLPVWAAVSAGMIPALELPALPLASEIVIAADHDPVGLRFASKAADLWTLQGRIVRISVPPKPGQDFADVLFEEREAQL